MNEPTQHLLSRARHLRTLAAKDGDPDFAATFNAVAEAFERRAREMTATGGTTPQR